MGYTPHVLVIGGGAIGTGIARDLALRGLEVTLVERGPLTNGATGRTHGLLHSGARFADSHPERAAQCNRENERLRSIASHCVEETGGLFVSLTDDEYVDRKQSACEEAGISVEELDGDEVQKVEPRLSAEIERGLFVPDGTIDPFQLTLANARSALEYDTTVMTHTEVSDITVEDGAVGTVVLSPDDDEGELLEPDYVVNAAGPWVDTVAAMADVDVPVERSAGAMVVMNERPTEAVVNRCRPPDEADLVVPYGERCILGTTDSTVDDPDQFERDGQDVDDLVDALGEVVPELPDVRAIRSYWGLETAPRDTEGPASECEFSIFDHEERDGLWGLSSVVGGNLTMSRLVAEKVTDHVCAKFGIARACLTAERPLPRSDSEPAIDSAREEFDLDPAVLSRSADRLGSHTRDVLDTIGPNPVVCACESVTRAEVREAVADEFSDPTDIETIRTRTQAGMGECQGARCCLRVASQLYPQYKVPRVNDALTEFYQDRWLGQRHALWGEQLGEAMGAYALHATTMNRDGDLEDVDIDGFATGEWDDDASDSPAEVP
ncbi:MAG: glycerol-3-phosphate dehydrogenase [Haloarculaceae archaeon]|jgi:glycerol-3-phosphate dehydrogenase